MKLVVIFLLFITAIGVIACTKGGNQDGSAGATYAVTSTASSKQLVPLIDTTATGTFTGFYDEQTNTLTYTFNWNDLWRDTRKDTITSISFYGPATPTTNGTLVRTSPFVNTNRVGSINLGLAGNTGFAGMEIKDFMAGNFYFTINTRRYPAGILRGQLALAKK